jgi:hypothetical protein
MDFSWLPRGEEAGDQLTPYLIIGYNRPFATGNSSKEFFFPLAHFAEKDKIVVLIWF